MSLAEEIDNQRQRRRQNADAQWVRSYHPRRRRPNEKSRAASTDLARLDISDWLADQRVIPHPRPAGDTWHVEGAVPEQWLPDSAIRGVRRQPHATDQSTRSIGDTSEPSESLPGEAQPGDGAQNRSRPKPRSEGSERGEPNDVPPYPSVVDRMMTFAEPRKSLSLRVKSGDRPEDRSRAEPQSERSEYSEPDVVPSYPSAIEQVKILAEAMTESTWPEIAAELGDTKSARDIKRQLAYHGWCDLFIGLVQVIEAYRQALDRVPEEAKDLVKGAICRSSMDAKRSYVTSAVVDLVVDRVWQAFKGAMCGQVPLLSIITREDALRSLRILAVFTCPAPEKHKEVREHALKPLGDDAKRILTEQTKTRLAKLFDEWATGGDKSTSADVTLAAP